MMQPRIQILFLLILVLPQFLWAQGGRNQDISVDCVVCHASFHDNPMGPGSLLPDVDIPVQIQGQPAHIAREQMCYTCHDGTIMDSRETFGSSNHRAGMDIKHARVQGLPLDQNGDIYCGTCHSPHSLKPIRKGGFAPFLREQITDSRLCVQCHGAQSKTHQNHPIHVKVEDPDDEVRRLMGESDQVECLTCHPIHSDRSTQLVEENDRTPLCATCHSNQFQIELTDHDLASSPGDDLCSACHRTHEGYGDLMWATKLSNKDEPDAYCLDCHSSKAQGGAKDFAHEGHPYRGIRLQKAVPDLGIRAGEELRCVSCHDPHQWEFGKKHRVTAANEEGTEYTSFLKLPDDAQGQLCVACHAGQSSMFASDHSVAREGFQQYFRETGGFRGQCSVCHSTHEPGFQIRHEGSDAVTGLCLECHNEEHYPTAVVHNSHPVGIPYNSRSGLSGFDSNGETLLACNTCHDPHHWGEETNSSRTADLNGNDRNSFLTIPNWPQPDLCLDCHPEQETLLTTDHDQSDIDRSACTFCHAPHNAATEYGILARWGEAQGESFNEKHCFSCHQEGAIAAGKQVKAYEHPREYGTLATPSRGLGEWLKFPLFTDDGPSMTVGHIDCFTCHDPHTWSHRTDLQKPGEVNAEGNDLTSFLRNPSHLTLCTDCHGPNTLWKYNYYHVPNKRKRY